jgi:hypothetical protein
MSPKNVEMKDVGELASAAVRIVSAIERDKGVTMLYAIDVFRGSKIAKVSLSFFLSFSLDQDSRWSPLFVDCL